MDFDGSHYYRVNRILLTCLGLWPYQTRRMKYIYRILLSPFLLPVAISQLSSFITKEYSVDLLLNVLSLSCVTLFHVIKYYDLLINNNRLKELLDRIRYDWNSLKGEEELKIIHKCANTGRVVTIGALICLCTSLFLFTLVYFAPNILDVVMPLNESRQSRQLSIAMEYFIDQEKYIYLILPFLFLTGCISSIMLLTMDTLAFVYTQHIRAMFRITSYRIERVVNESQTKSLSLPARSNSRKSIVEAIESHQKVTEFSDSLKATFGQVYLFVIPMGVISLSINLYRFSEYILRRDIGLISMSFLFVSMHFVYMYFGNYIGQEVIDSSNDLFEKIRNTRWYATPLRTQRYLLMIMQRSMKTSTLIIGTLFVPSFEGFATLVSMSLSYFTVIYSTRRGVITESEGM